VEGNAKGTAFQYQQPAQAEAKHRNRKQEYRTSTAWQGLDHGQHDTETEVPAGSDADTLQVEDPGLVSEETRTILDDATGNGVKVLNLVGTEALKNLSQPLDEAVLLLAGEIVGSAELHEDLIF